jgi:hypothetical protein
MGSVGSISQPSTAFGATTEEREQYIEQHFPEDQFGQQALLDKLFPTGFDASTAAKVSILAVSNKDVDEWNEIIANMNPEEEYILQSRNWFTEVCRIL